MQDHYQRGADALQSRPWAEGQVPWEVADDPPLKTVYKANAPIILENHQESSVSSSYNVNKAIIVDTKKVEGNSAYGGTIMDQEKFQTVKYVQGVGRVMIEANKPQFKKLSTLLEEDEYFEVEKSKEQLDINLPIQIGYFILQYAKLRMLQFYYDYQDVYVDRGDFAYCEMDTDSAYMALSGPTFTSVVKPDLYCLRIQKSQWVQHIEG